MSLKDNHPYKVQYVSGVDNLVRDFYMPTLAKANLYQRRTGYFNSRALAMAARGLTGLLNNGGKMQLLCSVQLEAAEQAVFTDFRAYAEKVAGEVGEMLRQPYDQLEKHRLALLAKMLETGRLEIKIAYKKGGIYHEKAGIFYDHAGNIVAFNGSGNETPGGWVNNTESFHVFTSWEDDRHIQPEIATFDRLWNGNDPATQVIDLPFAAIKGILEFKDYFREGMDEPIDIVDPAVEPKKGWQWTPELAYVFEAPRLWNHRDFAYGETAVTPFEHQDYIASTVLENWPPRFMFADEVGLGKTIEAGLVIKGFLAAGRIDRMLILAPANVMRQWQNELYTKFGIEAWRLDGEFVVGPASDSAQAPPREKADASNPFRSKPILIASSQLVRSEDRREQVLGLEYDLVVVDEAHHARASQNGGSREPNKLLETLEELRLQTQGLILMTATPIQVDRRELWDLLNLLELPGKWQDEDAFNQFFTVLDAEETDWAFLLDMVASSLDFYGVDETALDDLRDEHPNVDVYRLSHIMRERLTSEAFQLEADEKRALKILLYRHTPIRFMVFRNTRELLKEYRRQGKFSGKLAERDPQPEKINLRGDEEDPTSEAGVYHRIDHYVREYYAKYDEVRAGLGFIMEVYRKRLTSSLYAIRCSLERRHERVRTALLTGDYSALVKDLVVEDPDLTDEDVPEKQKDFDAIRTRDKIDLLRETLTLESEFLDGFLKDLRNLPVDSKAEHLDGLLRRTIQSGTRQVIVFTQFGDTMNFLLEYFRDQYGSKIGSYSGAGGTYWDGNDWANCTKQDIQTKFRDPADPLSILFCTDAAAEGLNLQSCDTLVNYDIPWNPMRIEQRIGRVDRIGQESPVVTIHTLFYADTVETRVYERCLERIGYFKSALGHLQPILKSAEKAIRKAALARTPEEEERALAEMDAQMEENTAQADENLRIDRLLNHYKPRLAMMQKRAPITQKELETVLKTPLADAGWVPDGKLWRRAADVVTFDAGFLDRHGGRVEIITPRSPLPRLIGALPEIPRSFDAPEGRVHRLEVQGVTGVVAERRGTFHLVQRLPDIRATSPDGTRYGSLDEARDGLKHELDRQRREYLESQLQAWRNRKKNWEARVEIYLERVAYWKWRTGAKKGALDAYVEDTFLADWRDYLADPDRQLTRRLVEYLHYRPKFDTSAKRPRGRAPKQSPRETVKEDQFFRELERIHKRTDNLSTQLRH